MAFRTTIRKQFVTDLNFVGTILKMCRDQVSFFFILENYLLFIYYYYIWGETFIIEETKANKKKKKLYVSLFGLHRWLYCRFFIAVAVCQRHMWKNGVKKYFEPPFGGFVQIQYQKVLKAKLHDISKFEENR